MHLLRDALPAAQGEPRVSTLVLAVGSPFGDDRLGWEVLAALRRDSGFAAWEACGLVSAEALDRPGAGLVHRIAGAHRVVLIDAVRSGAAPGTMHRLDAGAIERHVTPASSHAIGLGDALALTRALGQEPARLVLFGVEIGDGAGSDLSNPVRAAMPRVVRTVIRHLAEELDEDAGT